jgi:hypothetical protein
MSSDTFRRFTRASVDAAVHSLFRSSRRHAWLSRMLHVLYSRSDLMRQPPRPDGEIVQVVVLERLLRFTRHAVRSPDDWPGASGHPLAVVHSFASHLFGHYPTPRFLASAWFDRWRRPACDPCQWFVDHARGKSIRSLALPVGLTRRMAHEFLRTPDHVPIHHALRRAEILGLGGTPELAHAVLRTRLADNFVDADRWREALAWLARCGDTVDLDQIRPVVDYLHAHLQEVALRHRSFASVMRDVTAWHTMLGRSRVRFFSWPRSRWNGISVPDLAYDGRHAEWTIVELLDSYELAHEGRKMRHCVATYASWCAGRRCSIWSLRHRVSGEDAARSVLTIEVNPFRGTIVQVRGVANSRPHRAPYEIVQRWAATQSLEIRV